jgi:hypothetical protein
MFDFDEFASEMLLDDESCRPSDEMIDFYVEAAHLDLPFDLHNVIDNNPFVFGEFGDGPLLGETVRFGSRVCLTLDGTPLEVDGGVATVLGDAFGRVLLAHELCDGIGMVYLGWIDKSEIEVLDICRSGVSRWLH